MEEKEVTPITSLAPAEGFPQKGSTTNVGIALAIPPDQEKNEEQNCSKLKPFKCLDPELRKKLILRSNRLEWNSFDQIKKSERSEKYLLNDLRQNIVSDSQDKMPLSIVDSLGLNTGNLRFDKSSIEGWGVRATMPIKSGELVVEYLGEVIRNIIGEKREKYYESIGIGGTYVFRLDDETFIDATLKGGIARFINHSCDPNCESKAALNNGKPTIALIAKRDILPYEEITYDYKLSYEPKNKAIKCLCGSPKCRGWLNWREGLYDDDLAKTTPFRNIPEKTLCTLLEKGVLSYKLFEGEMNFMIEHSKTPLVKKEKSK